MTARDLTKRYVFALGLVALMASAILGLSLMASHQAADDASLINASGKQRMLSQRISLLTFEFTHGALQDSHDDVQRRLDSSIDLFLTSHEELAHAADRTPEIAAIYHDGEFSLDVLSQRFVADAREILENGSSDEAFRRLATDAEIILPRLDAATSAFENAARDRAEATERLEWLAFLATLVILLVEAIFIFRPAAQSIGRSLVRLKSARDKAEAGARAKADFLANMSHEIRTPLNGVLGMAEALNHTSLNPDQKDKVRTIQDSGDLLLAVVNDILDLSKIDSGKVKLESIPFEVRDLTHWATENFAKPSDDKNLDFQVELDSEADDRFLGDPTRLRQVLANLLSNAVKFTNEGTVKLTVRRNAIEKTVELEVADTGVGIQPDRIKAIFDPFVQADVSTTRTYGGTGLGLSITRRLIEMMGGKLIVESIAGEGSQFRVSLPLESTDLPLPASDDAEMQLLEKSLEGKHVLVVDDISINRMVLFSLLKSMGVVPTLVENGPDAIESCQAAQFDAVLMDIRMPGMNGDEASRRIREQERIDGVGRTPIIAASANVLPEQTAAYRAAGMDGAVTKPVVRAELVRELARLTTDVEPEGIRETG